MKEKFIALLFLIYWGLLGNNVSAQNQQISSRDAVLAASNWVRANYPECRSTYSIAFLTNAREDTLLYEIMFDSVTVLMSGSKACIPMLGSYKCAGSALSNIETLPCSFRSFINTYIEEIDSCFTIDTINLYHSRDWEKMKSGRTTINRSTVIVAPLISTKWGQSYSNTGADQYAYNYYIQSGDNCQHCLVGCGAVALAQIMNYWQYPVLMYNDIKQFDWCNMSNTLDSGTNEYEIHRNAIAHLMSNCATAIGSTFGCYMTNSTLQDTRSALVERYGYNGVASYYKRSDYTGDWNTLLMNYLNIKRPILYRGSGSGGHAFVCDGYRDDGKYHFNWGWLGEFDGFFSIDNLTPGNHNYTNNQAAIVAIEPPVSYSICDANLALDSFYTHNSLWMLYGAQNIVPQTMTTLISASNNSNLSWRTIYFGDTVYYRAHKEIVLRDGFTSSFGSEFTAQVVPCLCCDNNGDGEEGIGTEEQKEPAMEMVPIHHSDALNSDMQSTDLYPNPTDGDVTMTVDGEVESVVILDINGNPQGGWDFVTITDEWITLNVRQMKAGVYILTVRHPDGNTETAKFVKNRFKQTIMKHICTSPVPGM